MPTTFYSGQKVEALWDGDEYFKATVKSVNANGSVRDAPSARPPPADARRD